MDGKSFGLIAGLFLGALQTACMTDTTTQTCQVIGLKYLAGAQSEEDVCERFQTAFYTDLGDARETANWSITLSVEKRGSISALVKDASDEPSSQIADISLDVMDRSLAIKDVDRLAKDTAKFILSN